MPDHITNRAVIVSRLREELVGPSPQGEAIDCSGTIEFPAAEKAYGPWRQLDSGEEILLRDPPAQRYGVGVLYPIGTPAKSEVDPEPPAASSPTADLDTAPAVPAGLDSDPLTEQAAKSLEELEQRAVKDLDDPDDDDFDLSAANAYRPSSMGISFLAEIPNGSSLLIEASGGRYRAKDVHIAGQERPWTWWLRSPVTMREEFDVGGLPATRVTSVKGTPVIRDNAEGLDIHIEVYSRQGPVPGTQLLTVCLVNRSRKSGLPNDNSLFQASFMARISSPNGKPCILPYPKPPAEKLDNEEETLELLYRRAETFAVGHGCAAGWDAVPGEARVAVVRAECLPEFETPSITPDITRRDGSAIEVSMAALAGLVPGQDGFDALSDVVELYSSWVQDKDGEIGALDEAYRAAARRHIDECRRCASRMRAGLDYLKHTPRALRAFQLANHAMLLQQINTRPEVRRAQYDAATQLFTFSEDYADPELRIETSSRGRWRAFQIAFLLMAMQSSVDSETLDRETVELIWFPTGGGKTEAYLGLAAFALFMRRLIDPDDAGVHVLMRYTLRLLTAQQFQRASGLICAMEYLRRRNKAELGTGEFSIGIWLGGSTTPNKRDEARVVLSKLQRGDKYQQNLFILDRCPWCGAQLGPIGAAEYKGKIPKGAQRALGYEQQGRTVVFKCPDRRHCPFGQGLPVYVIDQDIYEQRPSLVIGTVDKFAMLAWRPDARAIFGIGPEGGRQYSPPGLIIQDELHLISGPLGSMVGLYEGLVEELCTDRRGERPVRPKIVSSTATIRRYADQIKALYARDNVALFPPPGLDAGDSFFAQYARQPSGTLEPGRLYVGVHAPGLGSLQTAQVRTFSALLQAPVHLPPAERDPWWTLLLFFNSLRELGTTVTLFQSDIPDYLKTIRNRTGIEPTVMRRLWRVIELTGRLRSDEVPEALADLAITCTSTGAHPVDACLASNIIEVGIDVDRLSLMAVVGQPKTTSQYIQVTGRVGRRWWERPGLVVTIYGASKPRDRSHFERFRSYHERLYAQVEPTSVTPFSPPVLDRALHAVMTAYARQVGDQHTASSPEPYPHGLVEQLEALLLPRVQFVDSAEMANFKDVFARRAGEWARWKRREWSGGTQDGDIPLLRAAGAYASRQQAQISWSTPQSMRNVDAECEMQITNLYLLEDETDA